MNASPPPTRTRTRRLLLGYYAALGPIIIWCLYATARNRGLLPAAAAARLDDLVLLVTILSGGFCAFIGLPGTRLLRAILSVVYLLCMTWLVLYVGIWVDCSFTQCL